MEDHQQESFEDVVMDPFEQYSLVDPEGANEVLSAKRTVSNIDTRSESSVEVSESDHADPEIKEVSESDQASPNIQVGAAPIRTYNLYDGYGPIAVYRSSTEPNTVVGEQRTRTVLVDADTYKPIYSTLLSDLITADIKANMPDTRAAIPEYKFNDMRIYPEPIDVAITSLSKIAAEHRDSLDRGFAHINTYSQLDQDIINKYRDQLENTEQHIANQYKLIHENLTKLNVLYEDSIDEKLAPSMINVSPNGNICIRYGALRTKYELPNISISLNNLKRLPLDDVDLFNRLSKMSSHVLLRNHVKPELFVASAKQIVDSINNSSMLIDNFNSEITEIRSNLSLKLLNISSDLDRKEVSNIDTITHKISNTDKITMITDRLNNLTQEVATQHDNIKSILYNIEKLHSAYRNVVMMELFRKQHGPGLFISPIKLSADSIASLTREELDAVTSINKSIQLGTPESEKPAEYYKREIENSQENIKKASATITHLNAERVNIQLQLLTECLSALNELKMNPPRTLTEEDVLADHMFNAIINDNE
jgi:hypothetical protein